MITVIYVTFVFIILRFVVTVFNFVSDPKLRRVNKPYTDLVSILIPARNEEKNILNLLDSILSQDYPNYEVIVLDDDSSDSTYELCAGFASKHHAFRIIRGKELTGQWLGKNYACHQLAQQAKGDFFLFLDADVQVRNSLINSAVHRMYFRNLGLLSLFANQQMETFAEKVTVPLMHYILLNLLPLRLIYLSRNSVVAAASGQFMLFNADIYRQKQWHSLTKDKIVEDAEIMRQVKSARFNSESLLANGMISCRMYKSYSGAVNGFGKNALAAFNFNIFSFLIFLLLLIGGPMIVITTLNLNLITMMLGLILLPRVMISLLAGQSAARNVLLHPIQIFNLLIIAFLAIQRYLTKTTTWKGRNI
ncbi:glycosyltransferase [Mucilaginibacter ginsenosidivorans]|uniref:Glycosyltransferase family 2 protein n=1 Tax=Mucilaginibacter ginsenosidivorans TaxID=398053 RepID=A0A5B8UUD2_9SPHI|nr:glycosyltransferase [Mucilaginibacter ginsenosidivorans]QEC62730.1 glycosyltransferase family 2 protein [Mucilaginibacter ginsenosidivorans]